MAGIDVTQDVMDIRMGEAILTLRTGFERAHSIARFLAFHPQPAGQPDPLTTMFGYTDAEAYNIRVTFEALDALRTSSADTFDVARQLTGLE